MTNFAQLLAQHKSNPEVFHRWTVIGEAPRRGNSKYKLCHCACGSTKEIQVRHLVSGASKSCGCLKKELAGAHLIIHGESKTREHVAWINMIARCTSRRAPNYERYGGAGISVSSNWLDYPTFKTDMGVCPQGAQLDRINNRGNYCKENCRWVSPRENLRNRNNTLEFNNQKMFQQDIARAMGISLMTLWRRRKKFPMLTLEELAQL